MLFDPTKKEFDLPATAIKLCDGHSRQSEIVGQENESFVGFDVVKGDAAEFVRVIFVRIEAAERDGLIAADPGGFVDFHRIETIEYGMALGARHEKCGSPMNIDVVNLAVSNDDNGRNIAAQIQ